MTTQLRGCGVCIPCRTDRGDSFPKCAIIEAIGGQRQTGFFSSIVMQMFSTTNGQNLDVYNAKMALIPVVAGTADLSLLEKFVRVMNEDAKEKELARKRQEEIEEMREKEEELKKLNKPYAITPIGRGYKIFVGDAVDTDMIFEMAAMLDRATMACVRDIPNQTLLVCSTRPVAEIISAIEKNAKPGWLAAITKQPDNKKRKVTE
jgi:hypothetical protein